MSFQSLPPHADPVPSSCSLAVHTLPAMLQNVAALTSGRVSLSQGRVDGWPSNDVPLVVMYSPNLQNLTHMRRQTQAIGIRFLGYDRVNTLMDALSVLVPVVVIIDEPDSEQACRIGRQVLADDFTINMVRLVDDAEAQAEVDAQPMVTAVNSGATSHDGPFLGKLDRGMSSSRLAMALGRLGVLPRRLTVVKA